MTMSPAPKKQRTKYSKIDSEPERVASVSPEHQPQQRGAVSGSVGATEGVIDNLLCKLRNSNNYVESENAVKALFDLAQDDKKRKDFAETIAKLDGVGTLIVALRREPHVQSLEFCRYALGLLRGITSHVRIGSFVRIGGIKTILAAAKKESGRNVCPVGILSTIAMKQDEDEKYLKEVATDECIDFVLKEMKKWPNDELMQLYGCGYLCGIERVDDIKSKLRGKKICSLLGNAIDEFHGKDKCIYRLAKNTLEAYMEE